MGINVSLWDKPDIDQMLSVYESMQKFKQLSTQFSEEEIRGIFNILKVISYFSGVTMIISL